MKIIAFGASNSKYSINKQFASYVAQKFTNYIVEILDLNDYALPHFNVDLEKKNGIPENAIIFYNKLQSADLIIISLAEHNGSYTAVFKNLFDWMSRHQVKTFENKKMFLLSTSPGGRGGQSVMDSALARFPIHGADILGHFSLPFFQKKFDIEIDGIMDIELKMKLETIINEVKIKL